MVNMTKGSEPKASTSGLSPGKPSRVAAGERPLRRARYRLVAHVDVDDLAVTQLAYDVYDDQGDRIAIHVLPEFPFGATLEQAVREFRRHVALTPRQQVLWTS